MLTGDEAARLDGRCDQRAVTVDGFHPSHGSTVMIAAVLNSAHVKLVVVIRFACA